MLLKKINLENQLIKERKKASKNPDLITECYKTLEENERLKEQVLNSSSIGSLGNYNKFNINYLDQENIYHIDEIKKICIDYRLRFLDTKYFKGQIPQEAIVKIKKLEQSHCIEIR